MLKRHCIIISLLFLALCELYLLWSLWASLNVNVPVLWTRLVCYWVNAMSQFLFSFPLSETASTSIESPDSSCHVTIPLGYQNFCEVFSKMKAFGLLHWPPSWDHDPSQSHLPPLRHWKSSHAGLHHPSSGVHPSLHITNICQLLLCGKERKRSQALIIEG